MQLDADVHGRLIALAGLTDMHSEQLGRILGAHSLDVVWKSLAGGHELVVPLPKNGERPLPPVRMRQWGAEVRAARPAALAAHHQRNGIKVLSVVENSIPASVVRAECPPGVLFARGDVSLLNDSTDMCPAARRIAIVGTRKATSYGRQVARSMGRSLSAAGVSVVSGLAAGIDGAAHGGVLHQMSGTDARPVAVVGSGHDHIYPYVNRALWGQVEAQGVVVSEWPLGCRPLPWHFPVRNRLIVSLSELVVVIESALTGGSMITVGEATAGGKNVLAVPGPITSAVSAGPNKLISEQAMVCTGALDVLVALGLRSADTDAGPVADSRRTPSADGAVVLRALAWEVLPVERLMSRLEGSTAGFVLLVLHELEFDGWVARGSGGWFQRAPVGGR
jgi:DNA processing protein